MSSYWGSGSGLGSGSVGVGTSIVTLALAQTMVLAWALASSSSSGAPYSSRGLVQVQWLVLVAGPVLAKWWMYKLRV
jgi:hypothetical protein